MRNVVVPDAAAAVAGISDGMTVMVGGFGGAGLPRVLLKAVLETGVRGLTVISNNAGTSGDDLSSWFEAHVVDKIICSYPRSAEAFTEQYRRGDVELELVPQGTLVERIRAGGAGLGGFLCPVGVGTDFAKGKEVIDVEGRKHLLELPLKADFALVRARDADTLGNLNFNKTARNHCAVMTTAARVTVAEAARIVKPGAMDPEAIVTPCIFVNRILKA